MLERSENIHQLARNWAGLHRNFKEDPEVYAAFKRTQERLFNAKPKKS